MTELDRPVADSTDTLSSTPDNRYSVTRNKAKVIELENGTHNSCFLSPIFNQLGISLTCLASKLAWPIPTTHALFVYGSTYLLLSQCSGYSVDNIAALINIFLDNSFRSCVERVVCENLKRLPGQFSCISSWAFTWWKTSYWNGCSAGLPAKESRAQRSTKMPSGWAEVPLSWLRWFANMRLPHNSYSRLVCVGSIR